MRLFALGAFYQDIKCLFGEGAITVITRSDDNDAESKIIIKSIIQADADVIHTVDDLAIADNDVWEIHSQKIESICKRLHFGAKIFSETLPLLGGIYTCIQSYIIFELNNPISVLTIVAIILFAILLYLLWIKFLSVYLSKLPQKVFA